MASAAEENNTQSPRTRSESTLRRLVSWASIRKRALSSRSGSLVGENGGSFSLSVSSESSLEVEVRDVLRSLSSKNVGEVEDECYKHKEGPPTPITHPSSSNSSLCILGSHSPSGTEHAWTNIFRQEPAVSSELTPHEIIRSCIGNASDAASNYDYYGTVGRGTFGKVTLVKSSEEGPGEGGLSSSPPTVSTFAVKVCDTEGGKRKLAIARREAHILSTINHPFIVGLHHVVQEGNHVCMALEYAEGGDLQVHLQKLGCLPERAAKGIIAELTLALGCLHSHHIMYRDLKPENVLLDVDGHVKLTDFGLCRLGVSGANYGAMTLCGSAGYLAPEVVVGGGYGLAADWWQLGMLLLEITTGLLPWGGNSVEEVAHALKTRPLELPDYLSGDAQSFLQGSLASVPTMRLGSLGVEEVKRHAFFSGLNWGKIEKRESVPFFNPSSSQYYKGEDDKPNPVAPRIRFEVSHDGDGGDMKIMAIEVE